MKRDELRLEILKLVYAHGRLAAEAVGRAKELEAYVTSEEPKESPTKASQKGKAGNVDILS